jgi:hypothetical protein
MIDDSVESPRCVWIRDLGALSVQNIASCCPCDLEVMIGPLLVLVRHSFENCGARAKGATDFASYCMPLRIFIFHKVA